MTDSFIKLTQFMAIHQLFRLGIYTLLSKIIPSKVNGLKAGDMAPDFELPNQENKIVTLKHLRGHKVVLIFYPKDFTLGCTTQLCNIRDEFKLLQQHQLKIFGISTDGVNSHAAFVAKKQFPFELLADAQKQVVKKFGVYDEIKFLGSTFSGTNRTTFIISEQGIILHIIKNIHNLRHSSEIIKALEHQ